MATDHRHISIISPLLNLLPSGSSPDLYASPLAHFSSVPWTAALLKDVPLTTANSTGGGQPAAAKSLDASSVIPFLPSCRNPVSSSQDQLIGVSLSTGNTLSHMICFFRPLDGDHLADPTRPITQVSSLYSFGLGVSGYGGLVHGGMITAMMDEAMGVMIELNAVLGKNGDIYQGINVTAGLDIKFIRPVPAPGVVCVTARIGAAEGRKTRMQCIMRDEKGTELASCTSTWVALKARH